MVEDYSYGHSIHYIIQCICYDSISTIPILACLELISSVILVKPAIINPITVLPRMVAPKIINFEGDLLENILENQIILVNLVDQ